MTIISVEQNGAQTFAASRSVSAPLNAIPSANQQTLPSLPLKRSKPRDTLGDSGTRTLHGIITDEYNPQLQGVAGIRVYEEMRKSDGTVRAALMAVTLPIVGAKWFVNPATQEQKDIDVANFVEKALFNWLDQSWSEFVRQACLMLAFGVMPFEKVYTLKNHDGKDYITLSKLAPRLPKSILKWELNDGTFGIQQIRQDGVIAEIPGSKCMIFVNEREGDNWWGTSYLRAPYKHWYYKNSFYKIDAIAFERQGIGIPRIKMPAGYTDADEAKALQLGKNLRANESAVAIVPQGYEIDFMDMGSSTTRDPENSINHHNKEILQSFLAQFLELGSTKSGSGSHALSSDHSDLFLKALEAVAGTIAAPFNKDLIPELVDLNFNDITVYPILDFSGVKKVDITALGSAIQSLVTAQALHPTLDDEQYLRAALGLPPRSQEDIDEMSDDDPSMNDLQDNADIESHAGEEEEEEAEQEEPAGAPEEQEPETPAPKDKNKVDKAAAKAKPEPTNNPEKKPAKKPAKPAKKKAEPKKAHEHKPLPRIFDDGRGFKSWRTLTFAEQKIDWKDISERMDALEATFTGDAKKLLTDAKDAFMKDLHAAIDAGDTAKVSQLSADFEETYAQLLKTTIKAAYESGKKGASIEMGIGAPSTNADTIAALNAIAETIASKTATDLETKAKLTAVNAIRQDQSPLQTAGQIDAELDQAIDKAIDGTAGIIVGQAWNGGRNDAFQKNADNIYAVQRSEILDDATCDFCLSIDGYVVDLDDSWADIDIFHDNCRGIWVEIMKDEENPPEITGVPDEIGQYYGGKPNDLKQPRKPIVRPGSLAEQEVERRKNAAAKK